MIKNITKLIAAVAFTVFASVSNAAIMQDIIIENVVADAGNEFGITDGFSGVVGSITYNPANVNAFGEITPDMDDGFFFEVTFGSFTFDLTDDVDYPFFPLALLSDPAQLLSGIDILEAALFADGRSVEFGPGFVAGFDTVGAGFFGDVSFGAAIPEPSVIALFLAAFVMLRVRRKA